MCVANWNVCSENLRICLDADAIYVFELKVNGTARQALEQIDDKSYAIPYQTDDRKVVKVGVKFNAKTRVPEEWVTQEM